MGVKAIFPGSGEDGAEIVRALSVALNAATVSLAVSLVTIFLNEVAIAKNRAFH